MKGMPSRDSIAMLREHGDDELTRIFVLQRPALRRMIDAKLHAKFQRRLDASDIVQEGFIRARRLLANYLKEPKIPPVVWLRILCKQVLLENIRKQLRGKRSPDMEVAIGSGTAKLAELASSWMNQGERMTKRETIAQVQDLLKQLNETDREIIEMRHSDGCSFKEVAEQLEIPMETAKKRYYRAIDRFRESLGAELSD